jgi:tetratricopeptide (TPR) repeat protein
MRESDDRDELPHNRSEISGTSPDVVQAGHVHGGVHFHGSDRSPVPTPQQLPGLVRSFVNRVGELRSLDGILADDDELSGVAVSVITGTAGVGKTSLALHWAHRVRHHFPDGQLYVNLRGYDPGPPVTAGEVLDRFLRALDEPAAAMAVDVEDKAALYRSRLADRRMLIVLDNAASVGQVRPLLPGASGCLVIVTSRSRLSGLVVRDGARRFHLDMLSEKDAIALLRVVTAEYRADDDQTELLELARLCARLPLALRIAAERAASRPLMRLHDLICDLRDESALWDALTAENDDEADAVRTVFAWSYRALPEDAARLFRLLGLHPGAEFGTRAAAVLINSSTGHARRLLDVLVGAHLLDQSAPGRYQLHDLLRAYAADQALHEEPEENRHAAVRRVITWYARTAGSAVDVVFPHARRVFFGQDDIGPLTFADRAQALEWYEAERANLVAATRTASENGLHRIAWQLPALLRSVYASRNEFDAWLTTGRIGLDSARQAGDLYGEAEMHESLGKVHFQARRLADSEQHHLAALDIRREIGDRLGQAVSINALGLLGLRHRNLADALSFFEQSRTLAREIEDQGWEALALCNIGETYYELGRYAEAMAHASAALGMYRERGDRAREGNSLFLISMVQRETGRIADALATIQQALVIAGDFGNHVWEGHWLTELGRTQRANGRPGESLVSYQRAVMLQQRLGDRSREAMALHGTGEAYQELGRFADAADFHQQATALHRELGDRWQLALSLDGLATAAAATGAAERAAQCWEEALANLAGFDDAKASAKRHRITTALRRHSAGGSAET